MGVGGIFFTRVSLVYEHSGGRASSFLDELDRPRISPRRRFIGGGLKLFLTPCMIKMSLVIALFF